MEVSRSPQSRRRGVPILARTQTPGSLGTQRKKKNYVNGQKRTARAKLALQKSAWKASILPLEYLHSEFPCNGYYYNISNTNSFNFELMDRLE